MDDVAPQKPVLLGTADAIVRPPTFPDPTAPRDTPAHGTGLSHGEAAALIDALLDFGLRKYGHVVWQVGEFGRPCMVYLYEHSVTTFDPARLGARFPLYLALRAPSARRELERELASLTTPKSFVQ